MRGDDELAFAEIGDIPPRILQMDGEMLSLKSSWKSQGTRALSHRHASMPLSPGVKSAGATLSQQVTTQD